MLQKIINFIKYHNAFTIGLILVFVASGVILASDTVREATIGKTVVEQQGIDNSALLTADLGDFDFSMQINGVLEDNENYYVSYTYQSLAIVDNVWQLVTREGTLTVSKIALGDRDLGLYVAEELGEIVDSELAYLAEVQTAEEQKGQTFVQETTKYTGLIGMILNPATKELPGYEPVVKPPEIIVQSEPAPGVGSLPASQTPSEEGNSEPFPISCSPAWVCLSWSPAPSTVAFGEQFTQTRTCTDYNNCGTEQGRPQEQMVAIGTYQPSIEGSTGTTTEATTTPLDTSAEYLTGQAEATTTEATTTEEAVTTEETATTTDIFTGTTTTTATTSEP